MPDFDESDLTPVEIPAPAAQRQRAHANAVQDDVAAGELRLALALYTAWTADQDGAPSWTGLSSRARQRWQRVARAAQAALVGASASHSAG